MNDTFLYNIIIMTLLHDEKQLEFVFYSPGILEMSL
jgi:hypothetical protein